MRFSGTALGKFKARVKVNPGNKARDEAGLSHSAMSAGVSINDY